MANLNHSALNEALIRNEQYIRKRTKGAGRKFLEQLSHQIHLRLMNKDPNFQFPESVQSDLFNYLRPEQQEFIRPILRVLKRPAQEELCCSLLDYLEQGEAVPPADLTLSGIFFYLTRVGMEDYDNPDDARIIRPLH